jgi:hypothetical protein
MLVEILVIGLSGSKSPGACSPEPPDAPAPAGQSPRTARTRQFVTSLISAIPLQRGDPIPLGKVQGSIPNRQMGKTGPLAGGTKLAELGS